MFLEAVMRAEALAFELCITEGFRRGWAYLRGVVGTSAFLNISPYIRKCAYCMVGLMQTFAGNRSDIQPARYCKIEPVTFSVIKLVCKSTVLPFGVFILNRP